ncbi:MAG: hypothetical protein KDA84_17870 [Planctomycetaceae bacterium]|nr:hypothetical protein [Planctomycetaceae bacterium]
MAGVLQDIDYFGSDGVSVRLVSDAGHDTIAFVLVENAWNEADTVEAFRDVGRSVMEAGFSKPLTVQLCNEYFEVQKTLTIQE